MIKSCSLPSALPARAGLLAALLSVIACPAAADVRLDSGVGAFSPFDGDLRAAYGANPVFQLGVSSAIGNSGGRMFLDVEYVHATGSEFTPDPTFEDSNPATYDLFPLTLGARFDLNQNPDQDLRVFFGLGVRTFFTRWEGPETSYSAPTTGAFLELRPEYRAGDHWSVWVRQRLDLVAEIDYGPQLAPFNFSGNSLSIGLSISLDHAPLTPPRNDS